MLTKIREHSAQVNADLFPRIASYRLVRYLVQVITMAKKIMNLYSKMNWLLKIISIQRCELPSLQSILGNKQWLQIFKVARSLVEINLNRTTEQQMIKDIKLIQSSHPNLSDLSMGLLKEVILYKLMRSWNTIASKELFLINWAKRLWTIIMPLSVRLSNLRKRPLMDSALMCHDFHILPSQIRYLYLQVKKT